MKCYSRPACRLLNTGASVISERLSHPTHMKLVRTAQNEVDLTGGVLILPAVAFANIGELAVDVLISTLKAKLIARLDDDNILACVGNNAFSPHPAGLLVTALELYQVPGSKVFLLQQRAPAICGRQQAFAEELVSWAKQEHVAHVLLLCGLDSQYRKDRQLEGSQLRFWAALMNSNSNSNSRPDTVDQADGSSSQHLSSSGCHRAYQHQEPEHVDWCSSYQLAGCLCLEQDVEATEREVHALLPPWPLLDAAAKAGLQHSLLTIFAAEGDNEQDALSLAEKVLQVLQGQTLLPVVTQEQHIGLSLQVPCSWKGLYGERPVDFLLV